MPKVRRVWSGEKVVISNLLASPHGGRKSSLTTPSNYSSQVDGRLSSDNSGSGGGAGANGCVDQAAGQTKFHGVRDADAIEGGSGVQTMPPQCAIVLRKDDPPPREIETQMFRMKGLLARFTENCLEGRHIPLHDWDALLESTADFHCQLDRLELLWDEEQELERTGSQDATNRRD